MDREKAGQALRLVEKLIGKYKYAILVLFAGVVLLSLGTGGTKEAEMAAADNVSAQQQGTAAFDLEAFESKLEQSLGQIDGVGRVKLTLSLKSTEESVYAADIRQTQQSGENSSYESSLSIASDSGYGEKPILVKNLYPTFRGALVLCDGADNDAVRLAVTQAVCAMCGVGADKVSVLKMQS